MPNRKLRRKLAHDIFRGIRKNKTDACDDKIDLACVSRLPRLFRGPVERFENKILNARQTANHIHGPKQMIRAVNLGLYWPELVLFSEQSKKPER